MVEIIVSDSEYYKLRDKWYRMHCNSYAQRKKLNLHVEGGTAYVNTEYCRLPLCKPTNPECFWFETYWALKDFASSQKI